MVVKFTSRTGFLLLAVALITYLNPLRASEIPPSNTHFIATIFTFNGVNWSPSDPANSSSSTDDILIMEGETTLTGIVNVRNLTILPDAILNVEGVLNLYGNLTIEGELIFKSSSAGNGELGYVSSTSIITGDATVERYMTDKRSYRMISSAVTTTTPIHANWQEGATSNTDDPNPGYGTHITGTTTDQTNGFDATQTGNPSLFTLDSPTQTWTPIPNTDVTTLHAGTPYLIFARGSRNVDLMDNASFSETTLRAKGKLTKGTAVQLFTTSGANQFVMFGNPYQSCINLSSVFQGAININTNFYIAYDPTIGDSGGYVPVSLPGGINMMNSSANQFLQPGHGGQAVALSAGNSVIAFSEYDKSAGNFTSNNFRGTSQGFENLLKIQLYTQENFNRNGQVHDGIGIIFNSDYNQTKANLRNVIKIMNPMENLGIVENDQKLAMQFRAMPEDGDEFDLYSTGYSHSNYVLKVSIEGLEGNNFYLEDAYTEARILISSRELNHEFNITDDLSKATDRFRIVTESSLGMETDADYRNLRIYPNPVPQNYFYLESAHLSGKIGRVSIYDISGRNVLNEQISFENASTKISFNSGITPGLYLVKVNILGEETTFKIVKQ